MSIETVYPVLKRCFAPINSVVFKAFMGLLSLSQNIWLSSQNTDAPVFIFWEAGAACTQFNQSDRIKRGMHGVDECVPHLSN